MNACFRFVLPALLCCVLCAGLAPAQDKPVANEDHPAVRVVRDYMKYMLAQDWEHSSSLVDEASMSDLRDDYLRRMKRPGVLTLDEEKEIIEKFKVKRLEDIEKITPKSFYILYHQILKDRHDVPPEVLETVRNSMQLRILAVALESDAVTHVLVRTKHNNGKVQIENLELISLLKKGDRWLVGLNEQVPKVTPLKDIPKDGAGPASSDAGDKKPATTDAKTPPKATPAKKTGKP